MQKMKTLLPSLKEKKRYLAFEIIADEKVPPNALYSITDKVNAFLGVIGAAEAGIMPIEQKQSKAVIRINHKYVDRAKASFLFINEINAKPVILKSLGVSGMLNKARKYAG